MTHAELHTILARRVQQLEDERDRWQAQALEAQRLARIRAICVSWMAGEATDAHLGHLALDEETLEIVAQRCTDETFRELRDRGMPIQVTDE